MKLRRAAVPFFALSAFGALGAFVGCNGLIGVKDIYLADGGSAGDLDATVGPDGSGGTDSAQPPFDARADRAASDTGPTCLDTQADPKNCGVCGHDCLGGECSAGKCAPSKITSIVGTKPWAIAVDATNVYWTDISGFMKGAVFKLPKVGPQGAPIKIAETGDPLVYDLVIDATGLYFSSGSFGNGGFVQRCQPDGGAPETIAAASDPRGLSMDGTHVYWANTDTPTDVLSAPKVADAGVAQLAPLESNPTQTHVDNNLLFWTLNNDPGVVRRCTLPACTDRADMIKNLNAPNVLATNSTLLFYTVDDAVFQIAKSAPAPAVGTPVALGQAFPVAIAADEKDVVWIDLGRNTNNFTDGAIMRCPITAGTAKCIGTGEVLTQSPNLARGITMDATAIYWTVEEEGTIYRLAR